LPREPTLSEIGAAHAKSIAQVVLRWLPVQRALGIDPLRDLYDLRHTYATFALRVGVPVFAVSRFMRTSIPGCRNLRDFPQRCGSGPSRVAAYRRAL
jgi:hypothetical protein